MQSPSSKHVAPVADAAGAEVVAVAVAVVVVDALQVLSGGEPKHRLQDLTVSHPVI